MQDREHNNLSIQIDYREAHTGISQILAEKYSIDIEIKALRVGDFIVDNKIAIERKVTKDFINSIIDGRLFRQAEQMRTQYPYSAYIIEGERKMSRSPKINPHSIKGAIINLSFVWRIPVFFSKNIQDTALLLWLIGTQRIKRLGGVSYRKPKVYKSLRRQQIYFLEGLPMVGPKLAKEILNYFGSIEKVFTASEDGLVKVPGIGRKRAQQIRTLITTSS